MSEYRFIPDMGEEELNRTQLDGVRWTLSHVLESSPFYREHLKGVQPGDIRSLEDIRSLPFTSVEHLREGYPLPLLSVPEEQVVRVHASSGTTGKRKILAYTQNDVDTWKDMFARCYEISGMTTLDRVQICVGYGLWTAGAGFQLGCERFGAMAVPIGPGNLEMQLQFLTDMQTTTLCSTASMALLMGEEVDKAGLRDKINLKRVIFGAETHSHKMRKIFEERLGLEDSFDIIGMTEMYGPGTGLECKAHQGIHYWADLFLMEILDPVTLEPVPEGEIGEMVVTSLRKEASPLVRYRTRDLTRLIPGRCDCGVRLPRQDKILGRSDDMIIYRGVNIYPGQIATVLEQFPEVNSEYQIVLSRQDGLDSMLLRSERKRGVSSDLNAGLEKNISAALHKALMARCRVEIVDPGVLPRSFAKTKRVIDDRNQE